jgi:2,4-dienoyl-CoA reductase-like NADH-dependent reductase (Old Yellow Enzyme family)
MPSLFDPLTTRGLTLPHRIVVSPMCQYTSTDGFANDWHLVHLGSRAVGGAALVITEATAVSAEGRISPYDLGIYDDAHVEMLQRIVRFLHSQGSAAGMQLAHAGRKGSTQRPWDGHGAVALGEGGWTPVAPDTAPFSEAFPVPRALETRELRGVVRAFRDAAVRARSAGFDMLELHGAHGYLLHEFLSPLTNTRTDEYGGSFENRIRFCLEVVDAVREVWPDTLPLWLRISATDWVSGGWDLDQSVELARRVRERGIDLIDCSSGGLALTQQISVGPGYQVPFADRIRREARIATGAVGLITSAKQADDAIRQEHADLVLLAREMLRDPYFPLRAARELGVKLPWPVQYFRAAPEGTPRRHSRGD